MCFKVQINQILHSDFSISENRVFFSYGQHPPEFIILKYYTITDKFSIPLRIANHDRKTQLYFALFELLAHFGVTVIQSLIESKYRWQIT